MKKLVLTCLSALLCLSLSAQKTMRVKLPSKRVEQAAHQKVKQKHPVANKLSGGITCSTNYVAGGTMDLNFVLLLNNLDAEYGDSLAITFPPGFTPNSSPNDPIGPDDGLGDGPEALNGVFGQTISWGNNDNNYGGIVVDSLYPFTINVTIGAGVSGAQYIDYHVSGDTYGTNPGDMDGTIEIFDVLPPFSGCTPSSIYGVSAWQEASALSIAYNGYVCNGHDSLQTRSGWQFYDGDGYYVFLVAGGNYSIRLDSCSSQIALSVSDSNGVSGNLISGAFIDVACPNQLLFTAPYTGKYYITASESGFCGTIGSAPIASASIKLLNSVACPVLAGPPINDTICGAIVMSLATVYSGNTITASATDPLDAAVSAAGFTCSTPNNTLWYSYSPSTSGTYYVTTNSPVGGLDTWVGIFEGSNCTSTLSAGSCMVGAAPGFSYIDTVALIAGTNYYIMIDGFTGAVGAFDLSITQQAAPAFLGCLPSNTYTASAWQETSAPGITFNGYVCNGHDSLQTLPGWNFYDGDGYFVKLVAGGQYRISLDSCVSPIALTVSDSLGAGGTIISGAYVDAACPNHLNFTAPYTGTYFINASLDGICGNSGSTPIASASIKLLNAVNCPALPPASTNDSICNAISMALGTIYSGDNTSADATDSRDADVTAAGYTCSTPNNTVWYSYSPSTSGSYLITITSPVSNGLSSWVGLFEAGNCTAPFTSGVCMSGATPGTYYIDTVNLTSGSNYYIMIDGFSGSVGAYTVSITQNTGVPTFTGCIPTNTYSISSWQEPSALGTLYNGYVCSGHDSLQTRGGWQFYDGDGYFVYLIAGGQYRFTLDSCTAPIALTVSDSSGSAGAIIPGAFVNAACPTSLTFTAPYTGKYYVNASLNGVCGNSGTSPIASAGVKLLNPVLCPTLAAAPVNDTICGAISMNLGTSYSGNNTSASLTDPRDGDVAAAGYTCSSPNNTLWYSYTPAVSDTFVITMTSPAAGGLDAWIGIFEGGNSCNDAFATGECLTGPSPGGTQLDSVILNAGTTYYYMVDGYAGAVGTFSLQLNQLNNSGSTFPYNDTICGAINMTLGTTYADNSSSASIIDPSDANAISAGYACGSPNNTLWYSYTPSVTDTFYMSSSSPLVGGMELAFGLFQATACSGNLTYVNCYYSSLPGGSNVDTLYLTSGTSYYFMMDGLGGSNGLFTITLTKATHGVGINELQNAAIFTVYPNPTEGLIHLNTVSTSTDLVIYNALGAKVFEQSKLSQGAHTFNLSALAKGIYSVKAISGNQMEIKTISINH